MIRCSPFVDTKIGGASGFWRVGVQILEKITKGVSLKSSFLNVLNAKMHLKNKSLIYANVMALACDGIVQIHTFHHHLPFPPSTARPARCNTIAWHPQCKGTPPFEGKGTRSLWFRKDDLRKGPVLLVDSIFAVKIGRKAKYRFE